MGKRAIIPPQEMKKTYARNLIAVFVLAVAGGAVGTALIDLAQPNINVGHGNLLGPSLGAGIAAFLAYQFGVKKYFDEKKRDVLIERYVTDGLDALAKATADECEAALRNFGTASVLLL